MKLGVFYLVFVLALGCEGRKAWSRLRDGPYDVGTLLDTFLLKVNDQMKKSGTVSYDLKDFSIAGAVGKGVVLSELDTMVRTGPASVSSSGTVFLANATVGLKECYVTVSYLNYSGKSAPVIFLIGENSVQVAYRVDLINKTNCTLSWSLFKLLTLDKVTTFSPDLSFNNTDVSSVFKYVIVPELNKHFASKEFLTYLDFHVNPCIHRSFTGDHFAQLRRLIYVL